MLTLTPTFSRLAGAGGAVSGFPGLHDREQGSVNENLHGSITIAFKLSSTSRLAALLSLAGRNARQDSPVLTSLPFHFASKPNPHTSQRESPNKNGAQSQSR